MAFIAENATVGVNIYGYRDDTAVVYSATVFPLFPENPHPADAVVNVAQGLVSRDGAGTLHRFVYIENDSVARPPDYPWGGCKVDLYQIFDLPETSSKDTVKKLYK
jgi:hypothetical protein